MATDRVVLGFQSCWLVTWRLDDSRRQHRPYATAPSRSGVPCAQRSFCIDALGSLLSLFSSSFALVHPPRNKSAPWWSTLPLFALLVPRLALLLHDRFLRLRSRMSPCRISSTSSIILPFITGTNQRPQTAQSVRKPALVDLRGLTDIICFGQLYPFNLPGAARLVILHHVLMHR